VLETLLTGNAGSCSISPRRRYETQTLLFHARCESAEKVFALERQITQILALVRSARNRAVVVNRLPPEVLAKVLSFRRDDRDLISATHVCERWRSTLLSIPLLWTEVVFGDPDRTATYLERSKGAPLHVSVGGSYQSTLDSSAGDMSWIHRMDSLRINGDQGQVEFIAGQLHLPAPLLQSLTFNTPPIPGAGSAFIYIPPGFLDQQVPSLRNLTFLYVAPSPVTSIPLQHLTNLNWTDSRVVIEDLFALLASALLLEAITLNFHCVSMPGTESLRVITLNKLRKLVWDIEGTFNLTDFLIAPGLEDLKISMNYSRMHSGPPTILPPYREHFPLLAEPTALRYMCYNLVRTWDFTYTAGRFVFSESPEPITVNRIPDRWFSPSTPISFQNAKRLVVEGFGGYPLPGNIPIEQFGSLESLKLVGEVDRLLEILQPNRNATGGVLVPFLSRLELHAAVPRHDIPFEVLTKILKERKEAGHGVKTVRIVGEYEECPSGLASGLTEHVDVLALGRTPPYTGED